MVLYHILMIKGNFVYLKDMDLSFQKDNPMFINERILLAFKINPKNEFSKFYWEDYLKFHKILYT